MFARIRRLFSREEATPLSGTVITMTSAVLLPEENDTPRVRGSTSTGAGVSTKSNRLYLYAGGDLVAEFQQTQLIFYTTSLLTGAAINVSGVNFQPKVGGTIFDHFIDGASSHVDGTEDTLYTDTIPAGALNANGTKISGYYNFAIVGHAVSTNRIQLKACGTTIFDTAAVNWPLTANLTLRFDIVRVSATVVRCTVSATTTTATVIPYSVYTEITGLTLSNAQVLAVTDISTGTNSAAADVTAKQASIIWTPAA